MEQTLMTQIEQTAAQRDTFIERMLHSLSGLFDIVTIYLGDRLGFYQALEGGEWMTSTALAMAAGTNERYTREWLEQQTVTAILEVEDEREDAFARRYRLPAGHREVLTSRDSLTYLAPLAQVSMG